jgi:hypothetical protein
VGVEVLLGGGVEEIDGHVCGSIKIKN